MIAATASIILLASRGTITLSILVLQYASPIHGQREAAGVVSLLIAAVALGLAPGPETGRPDFGHAGPLTLDCWDVRPLGSSRPDGL